jgi:hypothetical protein
VHRNIHFLKLNEKNEYFGYIFNTIIKKLNDIISIFDNFNYNNNMFNNIFNPVLIIILLSIL